MGKDDCIFCKIVTGQIPVAKVYDDQVVVAFLDIEPVSDGHTLIVPKEHFERMHDCPVDILGQVASRLVKIASAVMTATGCEGYNVLCNNGRAAGQLVGHLHFHIIPRSSDDGLFDRWPSFKYQQGKIEQIAAKIRERL